MSATPIEETQSPPPQVVGDSTEEMEAAKLDKLIAENTLKINSAIATDAKTQLARLSDDPNDHEEWAKLLRAAPAALTALAFAFAAAKVVDISTDSATVQQTKDPNLSPDLKTNITNCYNDGLAAFNKAQHKMSSIALCIGTLLEAGGTMEDIEDVIKEVKENLKDQAKLKGALEELDEAISLLKKAALECTNNSDEVLQSFNKWMALTRDVHIAFVETLASNPQSTVLTRFFKSLKALLKASSSSGRMQKINPEERDEIKKIFVIGTSAPEVITVLRFCLDNLAKIKENLEELHSFFSRLHMRIKNVQETRIPKLVSLAKVDPKVKGSIGHPSRPKSIQLEMMKIRIDYMLAGAKAAMYTKASRSHIIPGVHIVTALSEEMGQSIESEKIDALIQYSEDARESIDQLIHVPPVTAATVRVV